MDSVSMLLIGTNGTGKSTVLRKIAMAAINGGKKKVLILPSNPAEPTFLDIPEIDLSEIDKFHSPGVTRGAVRCNVFDIDEYVKATRNARNTVIISDDFRAYFNKQTMHPIVRRLLISRRHHLNDYYFAAHGFTQVPGDLFSFTKYLQIFRCLDNPKRHRDKLLDANQVLETIKRVNETAERTKNPYYYEIVNNL